MAARTRELIDGFMGQKRLAIVGVSRDPKDFSRMLFREFLMQGYDVIPVNPNTTGVEGRKCFARVGDITPGVGSVLLMTPPAESAPVLREAIEAGVRRVWLYRAVGKGAIHQDAVALCREKGIDLIAGYCPFMFFPKPQFFHRLHGFFMKLAGTYPS
jgi:predicted CoA-binding protein